MKSHEITIFNRKSHEELWGHTPASPCLGSGDAVSGLSAPPFSAFSTWTEKVNQSHCNGNMAAPTISGLSRSGHFFLVSSSRSGARSWPGCRYPTAMFVGRRVSAAQLRVSCHLLSAQLSLFLPLQLVPELPRSSRNGPRSTPLTNGPAF